MSTLVSYTEHSFIHGPISLRELHGGLPLNLFKETVLPATKLVNTPSTPAGIRLRVSFTWDIEPFRTDLFKGASATDKLRFQWVGRFYSELSPQLRSLRYDESVAADGVAPSHWRSLCHSMQETEASHRYDLRI